MSLNVAQIRALLRRYVITLYRSPFSSFFRIIVWPLLYLVPCFLALANVQQDYFKHLENVLKWYFMIPITPHVYHFINLLATDKENKMKSLMLSMGLSWHSYYIAHIIIMLLTILPLTIAMSAVSILYIFTETQTSPFAIISVFILFTIHLVGWIFVFSSVIPSPRCTIIVLLVILFENLLVYPIMEALHQESWRGVTMFVASMSPFESIRILSDSYTLCKNCNEINVDFQHKMASEPTSTLIIAIAFWSIVSFAVARWLEQVCPWQTDTAVKSPLFCLKFGSKKKFSDAISLNHTDNKYFEKGQNNREIGVHIRGVTKAFNSKPVINNLSFDIYKGETTLLLGHNGAGKTTLMSMILGSLSPDGGKISIKRTSLGYCPQMSILDDQLNVRQHLELFVDIKADYMDKLQRENHVKTTLDDVSLTGHSQKLPSELSGGMKRKLSLAMAFVGHSTVLVLDEPSSGLDPDSRVFIWNAIRRYRADRTVLLSTQHMEEADYLGDRIAIMSSGGIVCCGSSTFLNNNFGSCYKIRIECHLSSRDQIFNHIRTHFELAEISDMSQLSSINSTKTDPVFDMVIELRGDSQSQDLEKKMIRLLEDIEANSKSLGIVSHGLKSSSLEDVFLSTDKRFNVDPKDSVSLSMSSSHSEFITTLVNPIKGTDGDSALKIIHALLMKHLQTYMKDWKMALLFKIIVPLIAIRMLIDSSSIGSTKRYSPNLLYGVLVAHFIHYPTSERVSKFKTMLLTTNAKFAHYWTSQLLIDSMTIISLTILFLFMIHWVFSGDFLVPASQVYSITALALVLFGVSSAILAYILSTVFSNTSASTGYLALLYSVSQVLNMLLNVMLVLLMKHWDSLTWLKDILNFACIIIFPSDAVGYIFYGFATKCYLRRYKSDICDPDDGMSPVISGLLVLCCQILVFSLLLYFIERNNIDLSAYVNIRCLCPCRRRKIPRYSDHEIDEDVSEEAAKALTLIKSASTNTHSLVLADLSKSYVKGIKVVENLSLTVNRGECFGLLGVNGAGKSTTFSMIVAESSPDSGRIWMNGRYNTDDIDAYRMKLGYAPQSNPEMFLTPWQALTLMARLRNIEEASIPKMVNAALEVLTMKEHAHKKASDLSGGTKRKLTLGMALIGNPSLLALDEPTAGVDPIARRSIWQLLKSLRAQSGVSIIISSHAMEECEAICDRISIMARGRLRCVGTFLHLRSKFSQGCGVRVQFGAPSSSLTGRKSVDPMPVSEIISELKARLETDIGASAVKFADSNVNSATFQVTDNLVKKSLLFKILREFKRNHPNMSYMVNDSSLEDIFIALAREQQQMELEAHV